MLLSLQEGLDVPSAGAEGSLGTFPLPPAPWQFPALFCHDKELKILMHLFCSGSSYIVCVPFFHRLPSESIFLPVIGMGGSTSSV